MPTPAERRALGACCAILVCGLALRACHAARGPVDPLAAARLDVQIAAVAGAAARSTAKKGARRAMSPRSHGAGRVGRRDTTRSSPAQDRDAPSPRDTLIDIDAATARELERLPGVGPSLAQRIVARRDSCGAFGSLERLDAVRGVGPALLDRLRPHVRFGLSSVDRCAQPAPPPKHRRKPSGQSDLSGHDASLECGFGDAPRSSRAARRRRREPFPTPDALRRV